MPGMPYHLEKGPIFSVLEDMANSSVDELKEVLRKARDPSVQVSKIGFLDSKSLDAGPHKPEQRVAHLNGDWFGMHQGGHGEWQDQAPFDPTTNRTTGSWHNWYGNAEGIVRETIVRAAEVSLGLDHGAPPDKATRYWPISVFWKCPQGWMEGWVTWRSDHHGGGQVAVLIATPGNGARVWTTPLRHRPADGYRQDPVRARASQGMWVVTHMQQERHHRPSNTPSESGNWTVSSSTWEGTGPIVVVSPAERDGGVLHSGRPYDP